MNAAPRRLEATLSAFADRLFLTGGRDPGDAALALPPARLDLYRELVRGNYRSMLRFAFTYSFALVDRELETAHGADGLPRDAAAIFVAFLQTSPSRTHSNREIADRFLVFLPRAFPKLFARRVDLLDLMTLERAELRALYHADDPGRCVESAEADEIAGGALDALLARTIVRAPSASILHLAHPAVALRAALEHGEAPPPPGKEPENAAVSRGGAPGFAVGFTTHSDEAALALSTAHPGVPVVVERLAADWLEKLPESARGRDDAWKAGAFATAVLTGLRAGFFRAV